MIEKVDEFKRLAEVNIKYASTEEATKQHLILPFFSMLGYNIHNATEFVPEYDANVGSKKDAKVDYSVKRDGEPILIIEAKHHKENLDNHISQLFHYYAATTTKFAVLTNGVEYRFYADLDKQHVMDLKPFFTFNVFAYDEQDVEMLKYFRRNTFDVMVISNKAEELKYTNQIKLAIKKIIEEPDDDFIRYILTDIHKGKKTQQLIDKLRPIVVDSIRMIVDEIIKDRFVEMMNKEKQVKETEPSVTETESNTEKTQSEAEKEIINQINTTKEELEGFFNVKYILRNTIPWNKLHYRDAKNYFSILYDNKNYKWICRLRVEKANKYIIFPDGTSHGKSYPLDGLDGIFAYADEIIESAKRFIDED